MSIQDQFIAFCREHGSQPGLSAKLLHHFGAELTSAVPKPPLIWLEFNACSGDSISMLNTVHPELGQIICSLVEVRYWNALMPAQGKAALENLLHTAETANFILVIEGAIATAAQGLYCIPFKIDGYSLTSLELIRWLAPRARFIIAAGTCATFGGPSAARPNPSGSIGVSEIISEPVVNVSGCPINPDWFTGTLFHLLLFGPPEVDRYQRPTLFYGRTNHTICQRRSYFDSKQFASKLGDPECMISLGCMGPVTGADCAYRLWNDHLNWPVKASTPCIGCTNPGFPDESTPFFTPLSQKRPRNDR
ncbi:MAG TPA: hydrogenase small subunit, partial [Bacillota bacterium]|nr:hydrogenase small subunit [Bacillota bacterium]